MLTIEDVPYGVLYSFQPDYLAQLQQDSRSALHEEQHAAEANLSEENFLTVIHGWLQHRS